VPCLTVGGDYYDFFVGPDGCVSVVLGDVAGKGMPASLLMTGLQARVRLLAELQPGLAERMGYLDRSLSVDCPSNRFITFFYGIFDKETSCLRYCNAGHNLPLVLRNDGSAEMLEGGGTVLGILPELGYEEYRTPMQPGEMLVLFSDGVSEALKADGSEEEYGEERLARSLDGHQGKGLLELLESLRIDLDEWTGGSFHDDATLVLARYSPADG
jgi:sigma-B regulation protein RsbU (phosphoserine phosphatase)